jgi:DNA polymerase-1
MILIIDGSNYIHRAWFKVPPLRSGKFQTNAIVGTMNMLLADVYSLKPQSVIVVFDRGGKTFRHKLYSEYKANRKKAKDTDARIKDLYPQYSPIRKLLKAIGIRIAGMEGVEGDDIIATLATELKEEDKILIASNDKDFAQLVDTNISIVTPNREILNKNGVKNKYGVYPNKIVEYLMLTGDSSDNIPGVPGVGHKTAAKLLNEYGSLDKILKNTTKLTKVLAANLQESKPNFDLTRQLLTLDVNAKHNLKGWKRKNPDIDTMEEICKEYELTVLFKSLKALASNANLFADT